LPKPKRKIPGCSTEATFLCAQCLNAPPLIQQWLGLFEKATVTHLCGGDYSKLGLLPMINVLRAIQGSSVAAEMHLHDSVKSVKVWEAIKQACERDLLIYASTGTEKSVDDKLTGRILLVENIFEFKLSG